MPPFRIETDDEHSFARAYEDVGGGTAGDYSYVMGSGHESLNSLGIRDLVVFEGLNGTPQLVKFMLSMEDDFKLAKYKWSGSTTYGDSAGDSIFTHFYDVDYYWIDPDGTDVKLGISPSPPNGLYKALWTEDYDFDISAAMADDEHVWSYDTPYSAALKGMTLAMIGIPRTVKTHDTTKYSLPADATLDGVSYQISAYHVGFLDTQDRFRYTSESQYYGLQPSPIRSDGSRFAAANIEIPTDLNVSDNHRPWVNNSISANVAGSWRSFRQYYYHTWDNRDESSFVDGHRHPTMYLGMLKSLIYSKKFIRQRYWSMLYHFNCTGPEGDTFDPNDIDDQNGDTDNEDTATPTGKPSLSSLGGVFTHDYYGPLTSVSMIPVAVDSASSSGELITPISYNDVHGADYVALYPALFNELLIDDRAHWFGGSRASVSDGSVVILRFPTVVEAFGGMTADEGGTNTLSNAVDEGMRNRFETRYTSEERANAYVDYYTAYLESKIVEETLPREYKTKMQASRPIRVQDLSAIVGTVDYGVSPAADPTPSTSGGSTPSTSMGETY